MQGISPVGQGNTHAFFVAEMPVGRAVDINSVTHGNSYTDKTYRAYVFDGGPIPSTILEKLRDLTGKSIDYLLAVNDG